MERIFIFSEFYYPDQISSGYYVTQIAEHLAKEFDVTVICVSDVFEETKEIRNSVRIIRLPDSGLNKNNLIKRSLRFFEVTRDFIRTAKHCIESNDHVVCVTNPAFSIVAFAKLKRKINFILTIFVHDVFPENLVGAGIFSSRNLIYKFLRIIFNNAYLKVDNIVTCGRDMKNLFEKKVGLFKGEIVYIPNWGDPNRISADGEKGMTVRKKFGLKENIVFQFAGNIGRAQGIPLLLEASKQFRDTEVAFLFFGDGVLMDVVDRFSKQWKNVIYGGVFSREESDVYLNAADVAIVSLAKGMKGLGVPSKTYNIMAAGKPILYIGEADSEIAIMIEEERLGYIVSENSEAALIEGINFFRHLDLIERHAMGERTRKVLIEKYSKDSVLKSYSILFKRWSEGHSYSLNHSDQKSN